MPAYPPKIYTFFSHFELRSDPDQNFFSADADLDPNKNISDPHS